MYKLSESHNEGKALPNKKRYSGSFVILIAVSVAIVAFVLGTRGNQLLGAVAPHLGISTVVGTLDLSTVQETYRKLSSEYAGDINEQKMINMANKAIVESVDDPYTEYLTASEAADYNDDLSGNIGGGIGAELGIRHDKVTVLQPLDNSPAKEAGIKPGDVIMAVNGSSVEEETLTEVVDKIRGEVGTTVELTLVRSDEQLKVSVTRNQIIAPDVEANIEDSIGIIEVSRFDKNTGQNIRSAAEDFKKQGVEGVVLDLRGNGGGYLEAAVSAAGVWLNDKTVVIEKKNDVTQRTFESDKNPVLNDVPTVVLIGEGTASASEIVAGALRDHGAATIVGSKSFGKGSVQALIGLSNGAELKVTIAKWYTPKGNNINKEGIHPDERVAIDIDDINNGKDPQLDAALDKLKP